MAPRSHRAYSDVMKRPWMIAALVLVACTSPPTPQPTDAHPAFVNVTVAGVGTIRRGGSSAATLRLSFDEASVAAIARGPGSFDMTIADNAGSGTTVSFLGTPSTAKSPGSLGASATVTGNVLTVDILDSDPLNVEPIIVTGLAIATSSTAALGSIAATMGRFSGSLAGGATNDVVVSPGSVVSNP
jgi:hypothetical protein